MYSIEHILKADCRFDHLHFEANEEAYTTAVSSTVEISHWFTHFIAVGVNLANSHA